VSQRRAIWEQHLGLSRSFSLSLGAWVPSAAPVDQTDPLEPAGRRFANFVLVFHRALPDLQRMKLCYSAAVSSGTEVGIRLVRLSPSFSWTRGSLSTSDCRHGPSSAPEHAS
jgi:hypothetical protein